MRFDRTAGRRHRRPTPAGQGIQIYELLNLGLWATVFVAAGIILRREPFNTLAPFMAVGMVASTMIVHWARKRG